MYVRMYVCMYPGSWLRFDSKMMLCFLARLAVVGVEVVKLSNRLATDWQESNVHTNIYNKVQ